MKKILTFNQLLEAKEKKESWMPSVEEFENIEPYKSLLEALGGHADIRGTYQSKASITKGVRFIRIGATYECKVSPTNSGSERVNFTYGAYKIYSDIPFSTTKERERAMELFILYSIGKTIGYNINQVIFGDVSKFLTGETLYLNIKQAHADKFIDEFIKSAESVNDEYLSSRKKRLYYIRWAYIINRYLRGKGDIAIMKVIDKIEKIGKNKENRDAIIRELIRYADIDSICKYIKRNPLELYLLDDIPHIKKEVLEKTGIKDYSSIGRKLRNGMI